MRINQHELRQHANDLFNELAPKRKPTTMAGRSRTLGLTGPELCHIVHT